MPQIAKKKTKIIQLPKWRFAGLFGIATILLATPFVYADTIQQQINNLNNQNSQSQQSVNSLQLQASSYQDAINKLQQQIGGIQGAIAASQAQQSHLTEQIASDQQQIDHEKAVLAVDVKTMYVDGAPTTIEQLATSKNLSDFVDKQEYRTAVQNQLEAIVQQIVALQQQQQGQKLQVEQLLTTQKQQQTQLDSDRQQQANLLGLNQSQQGQYNQQIQSNKGKISTLEAEQARINAANSRSIGGGISAAASGGSGGNCDNGHGNGGYPLSWCNATQDSLTVAGGFPNRECTSFAYWYFTRQEGKALSVNGDAKQWVYTANRPVDRTPEQGAIAVSTAGPYGHVLIVLATPGQSYGGITAPAGYVITMSMNYDYNGHFIVDERAAGSLYYIH